MRPLPTKLEHEPLIDIVFECRFTAEMPMANVLPGFFVSKLNGIKSVNNLPAAELPPAVRKNDPNLEFSPLVRIDWENFALSIGDRNIVVGCKLPYPGWEKFKAAIMNILGILSELPSIKTVNRYSIKYIDMIPGESLEVQAKLVDLELSLGKLKHTNERFNIRLDFEDGEFLHILNLVSGATADIINSGKRTGLVIDSDSLKNVANQPFGEWFEQLSPALDQLHAANKKLFFDCLSEDGLNGLGPHYE